MLEDSLYPYVKILLFGNSLKPGNLLGVDINTIKAWMRGRQPTAGKAQASALHLSKELRDEPKLAASLVEYAKNIAAKHFPGTESEIFDLATLPGFVHRIARKPGMGFTSGKSGERKLRKTKAAKLAEEKIKPGSKNSPIIPTDGYTMLRIHYEKVPMYKERWEKKVPIRKLVMLHLNGGMFRLQRLKWQVQFANKHLPEDFRWPDKVFDETPAARDRRLEIELEGAEPWPAEFQHLCVFIGTEPSFKRWIMPDDPGMIEHPKAARAFWVQYLRKLKNNYDRLHNNGSPNSQFHAELYEVDIHDFYAHAFNYDQPGGYIVGSHLWSGRNALRAFEIKWPKGKTEPSGFADLKARIEKMRRDSKICRPIPLGFTKK